MIKQLTWLGRKPQGTGIVALLLTAAIVLPAAAVTLVPGTYKMQWVVSEEDASVPAIPAMIGLRKVTGESAKRFVGIRSSEALSGGYGPIGFLIDESKGAGRGYDMVYILPGDATKQKLNLRSAPRMRLVKTSPTMWTGDMKSLQANPVAGGSKSRLRDVVKGVELDKEHFADGSPCWSLRVDIRGRWSGWIKTDTGQLRVSPAHTWFTNDYSVPISNVQGAPVPQVGSMISVDAPEGLERSLFVAKASGFGGKLYEITVTPSGDAVTVRPYTGETATVVVKAVDGFGKPLARIGGIAVVGLPGWFARLDGNSGITVPVGAYETLSAELKFGPGPTDGISVERRRIDVRGGTATEVTLGGPVNLEIEAGDLSQLANRLPNQKHRFLVRSYIDSETSADFSREVSISIKDSSGSAVAQGKTVSDEDQGRYYDLRIPDSWLAGIYTIEASVDLTPYQGPVTVSKQFAIGKS